MGATLRSALRAIRADFLPVTAVLVCLWLPSVFLPLAGGVPSPLREIGSGLGFVGSILLVAIFLVRLGHNTASTSPVRVVRACLGVIGSWLIVLALVLPVVLIAVVISGPDSFEHVSADAWTALGLAVMVAAAPLQLVDALAVAGTGGALWRLRSCWSLALANPGKVWLLLGGLTALVDVTRLALAPLLHGAMLVVVPYVVVGGIGFVLRSALVAEIYDPRSIQAPAGERRSKPAVGPRPAEVAAAGTFTRHARHAPPRRRSRRRR